MSRAKRVLRALFLSLLGEGLLVAFFLCSAVIGVCIVKLKCIVPFFFIVVLVANNEAYDARTIDSSRAMVWYMVLKKV